MSGGNVLAVAIAVTAGISGSVQGAVLGRLTDRIGTIEALAFSTLVSAVVGGAILLVARQSLHGYVAGLRAPPWMWLGGILSAFIILSLTIAVPRIGVTATIGIIIAGQLVMSAVIDRFGLFGVKQIGLHWPRLLGIALLAAGAALSLRK